MSSRPLYLAVWRLDVPYTVKLVAARIEAYQQGPLAWCTASNATIAAEVGTNEPKTIRRALTTLRELGMLEEEEASGRPTRRRLISPNEPRSERTPVQVDPGPHGPPGSSRPPVRVVPNPGPCSPEPRSVRTPKERKREGESRNLATSLRVAHAQHNPGPNGPRSVQTSVANGKARELEWLD
jgi:hypothetical protein